MSQLNLCRARGPAVRPVGRACALVLGLAFVLPRVNPAEARAANSETSPPPTAGTGHVDFARDIEPLLAARCYSCHGAKKQESGLRLDRKAAALRGGEHGPLLVAGNSAASLLFRVTANTHPEIVRMPKKGEPLTAAQLGLLRAWIDQGAAWPAQVTAESQPRGKDHWAFKPPVKAVMPVVNNRSWSRTPIDVFILARLEREGLRPSPEADRVTLLRRLYLDLIGLPPRIEEVDAFLADPSPLAYDRVVERLLASPHYGERWGRHWLDAARYADSDGYEKDKSRQVWFYRDWVINALNRNLPYDQFIVEQIAGDLLPNATQDQKVATGFLRNSMLNEEGAIDPEQFRMDAMFDRMDCIGKSVLGLTIQCAQCHPHKFDPLTQEEYYRLFAYLNNDHEAQSVVYTPAETMRLASLTRQMAELEAGLRHRTPDWEQRLRAWEDSARGGQPEWEVVRVAHVGENAQRYVFYSDGSMRAEGYAPTKFTSTWRGTNALPRIGAFRLELFTDPNLPCNGPGRSFRGTCALTEFKVEAAAVTSPTNQIEVQWAHATADYANPERELEPNFDDQSHRRRVTGPVHFAIDGKAETAWGIDAGPGRRNQPRKAVFVARQPVGFREGTILTFRLVQDHGGWNSDDHMNNNLGRFRLSVCAATNVVADPLPQAVRDIFALPCERRTPAQLAVLFSCWRGTVPEFAGVNEQIEALWKQWPAGSTALMLLARDTPRPTAVLKRGDWLKPVKPVGAGVPAFLHPAPENADGSRLTLARWLVDRRSPTTARVCVNRIWQQYFGVGIVESPEDFGTQSPVPEHPELLDWLACEFMSPTVEHHGASARPWSLKHLHRLIVHSATYRQSSRVTPELGARDPRNRLLARGPRFRVEGEIVRDIALAASGLLNPKVGGPSIFSPAPEFLFLPPASYAPFPWKEETGPDRYRRGLYTFRRRSTPYPVLQTFDTPNGDFSCVRRLRSNTPLQALTSLNETIFVECAQTLARETLAHGGPSDADRVTYAFRRALSRPPAEDERQTLLALLARQRQRFADGWVNPSEVATGRNQTPAALPPGVTPTQLAAYTVVSRVLLNLDETITKE
jgi:hypothetical protein